MDTQYSAHCTLLQTAL